jgi:hypothetical protein
MTVSIRSTVTTLAALGSILLLAIPALAQDGFEFSGVFGYSFSEGAKFSEPISPEGDNRTFTKIGPVSDISYGAGIKYFFNQVMAVGFEWSQQAGKLGLDQQFGGNVEVTDMMVSTYHGTFTYQIRLPQRRAVFFYGGLGATQFDPKDFMGVQLGSETRFSTTWGAGIDAVSFGKFRLRGVARWTPTYVKSEPGSVWCDYYWGCYVSSVPDYAHQFTLAGGIVFRP